MTDKPEDERNVPMSPAMTGLADQVEFFVRIAGIGVHTIVIIRSNGEAEVRSGLPNEEVAGALRELADTLD
jgi:hypothetical protein